MDQRNTYLAAFFLGMLALYAAGWYNLTMTEEEQKEKDQRLENYGQGFMDGASCQDAKISTQWRTLPMDYIDGHADGRKAFHKAVARFREKTGNPSYSTTMAECNEPDLRHGNARP